MTYIFMRNFMPQHMVEPGEFIIIVGPSKKQRDAVAARVMPGLKDNFCFSDEAPEHDILKSCGEGKDNDPVALANYIEGVEGEQFSVVHLDVKTADEFATSLVGKDMILNGKCHGGVLIMTSSYMKDIPCFARANASVIILLEDKSRHNQEAVYEETKALFPDFDCFQRAFTNCTAEDAALVIRHRTFAPSPEKCLFWFKIPKN